PRAAATPENSRAASPAKLQTNTPTAQRPMWRLRTRAGDVTNTPTSQRPKRTAPPPRDDTITPPRVTRSGKTGEQPHLLAGQGRGARIAGSSDNLAREERAR